jgi:predicted AlkP superfamily pyrophosphatase or phosphodiesterase
MSTFRLARRLGVAALVVVASLVVDWAPLVSAQRRGGAARALRGEAPRLVVLLVVDQMRADYIDRFRADWTGGLHRLLTQGAHFSNAAYPFLGTYTCAGHATVGTGAFPPVHGIFQNTWYDRELGDNIPCTGDAGAKAVVYSGTGREHGPVRLRVPTLADEMRAHRASKVVSIALKARSAIMLAGHGGDAVTWLTDAGDGWQTGQMYAASPVPAVRSYLEAHPLTADHRTIWKRQMPPARYPEPDDAIGEDPPKGWNELFPHPLAGEGNTPDEQYRDLWQRSPWADAYVGRFAAAQVKSLGLGAAGKTDVLAVSFSSPDLLIHQFGPHSQEARDHYVRLDATIGRLLTDLDAHVGRARYVVALTSDHGVADIPEQAKARGEDAGRVSANDIRALIEQTLTEVVGPGRPGGYVARMNSTDVYFHPGVYEKLRTHPHALDAVARAVGARPGIGRVLRSDQVAGQTESSDRLVRAAALSHVPGASGDLLVLTKPGWIYYATGTTHGSANPLDQRVPIVLMGPGIKPGVFTDAATPADIAPTLASLVGVTLAKAQGRPLREALLSSAPTPTGSTARP